MLSSKTKHLFQAQFGLEHGTVKSSVRKNCWLVDVISTLDPEKGSVLRHMTSVIQPILENGIVDHSIMHRLLMEYFSIADKVLVCIISVVDDTKLITKAIIRELQQILKELVLDKNGWRPLLQLLNPNCSHYFSPNDLASLNSYIPSLSVKDHSEVSSQTETSKVEEPGNDEPKEDMEVTADEANKDGDKQKIN
ncbi:pumilio-like protein 24-like [Senna tora]|uniref:Pumilio-like protein 24-like n=1 Tax=Senna tora TaxID=362788 RepID=A0A834VWX2_9FABA|nr:pumilio-like protein 24-like [Senna tora]